MYCKEEIIFAVLGVLLLCSLFYGIHYHEGMSCKEKSVSFESYRHSFSAGCMVKHKGKWLPLENIRGFD